MSKVIRSDSGNYKVVLSNDHGQANFTTKVIVLDKPSVPKNLKVTDVNENSAKVMWDLPDDNGGSEITGYVVEKRNATKVSWTKVSCTTYCRL